MAIIEGYNMPDELYYNKDHTWVKVESDGKIRVGMNDFYQKLAGDTTYIDLPFEGDAVEPWLKKEMEEVEKKEK